MEAQEKQSVPQKYKLYDYFRSSACYRVRIALNLKGIDYEHLSINLREGEQQDHVYKAINPQGLVPTLQVQGESLSQSLAIIDYLDHTYPTPELLPKDPFQRSQVLELVYMIACDIHPLNNLRVLNYLTNQLEIGEDRKLQWYHHWVNEGFAAYEAHLQALRRRQEVSFGDAITLADVCLIPQVYNALRLDVDLSGYPCIIGVYQACLQHPAFAKASPEVHPDAI